LNPDSSINGNDRLVLYGYGVFETLRVSAGKLEVPKLHYRRMRAGAAVLGLDLPEYTEWLNHLKEIMKYEHPGESYALRFTLSGGDAYNGGSSQLLHHIRPIPYRDQDYQNGFKVCLLKHPRNEYSPCVGIKSANAIETLLGRQEASTQGAREGIWLNTKGDLTEGTVSNLFFVKAGVLCTPALDCGCLPGTRRTIILECARSLGIPVTEGHFGVDELIQADEVFLTNSLMGILPVNSIGDKRLPLSYQHPDSLTMGLRKSLHEYILKDEETGQD
jgi:4-amino-4-deoxychorismate lyase